MKAVVYSGEKNVVFKDKSKPIISEGWALIKTAYAGICGSDLSIYAGVHPRATAPLTMGHEFSGVIMDGHPYLEKGTPVTVNPLLRCRECYPCKIGYNHVCEDLKLIGIDCDGGMGDYVLAPIDNIIPLPEEMSLKSGALIEPIAVAVHAIRQGSYVPGDNAVVFGAGAIGLSVALTLRYYGVRDVIIVEPNKLRVDKARELGFETVNPNKTNLHNFILEKTNGIGIDHVFDCAGHDSVVESLTKVTKVRGNIVIVAMYKQPANVDMRECMFKELSMRFVRVYTDKDFQIAIDIASKNQEFEKIITHILQPEEAEKGFHLLTTPTNAVKVMYEFN